MYFGRPRLPMEAPGPAMPGAPVGPFPPGAPGAVPPVVPTVGPGGLVTLDMGGPDINLVPTGAAAAEAGYEAYHRYHVVLRGETLWSISRKYNISMQALIQVNNLRYPDVIYPGQRLIIPDGLHYQF
ncbi:MAG TPA: LysM domain-containing protein [Desulfobacteria bacterium]|nr:LysM domain-containing protein [Desulfobacteria bacterium]